MDYTTQKELAIHKNHRRCYSTPPKKPGYLRNNPDDTQKHSDNKKGDNN
jgi:hypothetical protein